MCRCVTLCVGLCVRVPVSAEARGIRWIIGSATLEFELLAVISQQMWM